jgi:hypothetical protein
MGRCLVIWDRKKHSQAELTDIATRTTFAISLFKLNLSLIVEDPILDIVPAKGDPFPNAEERRLFYVALTRAKKNVFLEDDPAFINSSFV